MSETALYKPEDLRPMLMASLTVCWVAAAGLVWLSSPWSAVSLIILGTIALIAQLPLKTVVLAFVFILPFDLQRRVGGHWVYLDLLVAAVALPLFRNRKWPPRLCWLLVPFFLYFLITGFPRSLLPAWLSEYAVRWVIGFCFSAAVALSGVAEDLALATGVTLVPLTTYALYQLSVGNFGTLYTWMNPQMDDRAWIGRSYSLMWHPNHFGEFAAMVSVMLIAIGIKGYKSTLSFSLAAVGIVGLLCSGSRGSETGAGIVILLLLIQTPKYWRKLAMIALAVLIIWGAQHYDFIPLERAEQLDDFTVESRLLIWGAAYTGWQKSPWIGLGTANFREVMPNFVNSDAVHAHSIYLQILAETGLIGFTLFFGPLLYLLWRAWKDRMVPVVLAGACALSVWFVHGFVDISFMDQPPSLLLLFLVIGLIVGGLRSQNTLRLADLS